MHDYYTTIPYVAGTSEPIKRALAKFGIRTTIKPYLMISNMFPKPKDIIPKDRTRGPVYSIPCKDCDATYVGESKRQLKTRLGEHYNIS